ncbi:hypothetical protein [Jeotgalicoccus halotolerans]|uniref:Uncharacterized protein n=1 Tax=Jeotgalicoccus halotolerans TaxID=157227 RepID=A0A3E0AVL1_9STAP|nr:hypothetical protein [Jeotgalicoccus halotolerans]REG23796.1 hypothetical protein DFR63_1543 [Jeotgalicoccus halotolerans]
MADAIKYDNGERGKNGRALNKISAGYEELAAERGEETVVPSMVDAIRQRQAAGEALSTMEKLIVGQADADDKRNTAAAKESD